MTSRELILEQFSKMDDKQLFKAFCRTNDRCQQCIFFKADCPRHEQWLSLPIKNGEAEGSDT